LSLARFSDGLDSELAEIQRRQVREMYRFAESSQCRHQLLARHFGEDLGACGSSCDACTGRNLLAEAPKKTKQLRLKSALSFTAPEPVAQDAEEALFLHLKTLRKRLADARGVPAYVVFTDATLQHMARFRPETEEHFLALSGVGIKKLQLYGAAFIEAIRTFKDT